MGTLVANGRMEPALVARIEASVTGRRRGGRRNGVVPLIRGVLALAVLAVIVWGITSVRRDRAELEQQRIALGQTWRKNPGLTATQRAFRARIEKVLAELAGDYQGDVVAEQLRAEGALDEVLGRPSVYVRGSTLGFKDSAAVAKSGYESALDAVPLCFLVPPPSRSEKDLLPKARLALGGGPPVAAAAPKMYRLQEALAALRFYDLPWSERIEAAQTKEALQQLERELAKAPPAAARAAMDAEILVAVFDEPNEEGGVTELDGEHAHTMRLMVHVLSENRTILRFRKRVDPSWITPNRRSQYARELDGCAFAIDARNSVEW